MSGRPRKQAAPALRRKRHKGASLCTPQIMSLALMACGFASLAVVGLLFELNKELQKPETQESEPGQFPKGHTNNLKPNAKNRKNKNKDKKHVKRGRNAKDGDNEEEGGNNDAPYLQPIVPVLPIFTNVDDAETHMQDTISKSNPTMAGVVAIMQNFLNKLHESNQQLSRSQGVDAKKVIKTFFELAGTELQPFEKAYHDENIFPVRTDDSIFLSLAAYREHLLADTMVYAFDKALHPDKVFIGAVVQNCFGKVNDDGSIDTSGKPCKTGFQVVGKNKNGRDQTKVSDAPPDVNGIVDFCTKPDYKKYCDNGQVRALYVHETESQGPAMARYYASKLWGGETFFVQCDAHLQFATHWDKKYIDEVKATRNYPKSVLSSYPPGFTPGTTDGTVHESKGARLCACETRLEDPNPIIRLNVGRGYKGNEERPTQIPFIAAGFFFARAEFLRDVPFDPFLPWCFMGEEIALSMRAWTHGWDIYAPRKNLIAHQYRPGRLGLPKFWETVNRLFHGMTGLNQIQHIQIRRIKNMVGYPDSSTDKITEAGNEVILTDIDAYGLGEERSWQDYMDFANLYIDEEHSAIMCKQISWCNQGLKD